MQSRRVSRPYGDDRVRRLGPETSPNGTDTTRERVGGVRSVLEAVQVWRRRGGSLVRQARRPASSRGACFALRAGSESSFLLQRSSLRSSLRPPPAPTFPQHADFRHKTDALTLSTYPQAIRAREATRFGSLSIRRPQGSSARSARTHGVVVPALAENASWVG